MLAFGASDPGSNPGGAILLFQDPPKKLDGLTVQI